jgi:hypothetical protein
VSCIPFLNFNFSLFTAQADSKVTNVPSLKTPNEVSGKNEENNKNDKKEKKQNGNDLRIPIFKPLFVQPMSYRRLHPSTAAQTQSDKKSMRGSKSCLTATKSEEDGDVEEDEEKIFTRPCPLISTAAVHVGKYFLIFGGFNNRLRERAEIWVRNVSSFLLLFTAKFCNCFLLISSSRILHRRRIHL